MATNWAGAAELDGSTNLTAADRMRQKTTPAAMTVRASAGAVGYSAAQLEALVAVFDTESDATVRHATLSRLVAYCAAAEATSVQDRRTPARALQTIFEDADLLLRNLYGFFGPAGLQTDRPTAELLFELESLVAVKRINAGLPALPGTSY